MSDIVSHPKRHSTSDVTGQESRLREVVYGPEEREAILAKMRAVSAAFYAGAVKTGAHPFIEFCGLLNEYIKVCERAHAEGKDFTQANTHSGQALPMETYEAAYLGEKWDCIYGPTLSDPKLFKAFMASLNLPFEVSVTARPEAPPTPEAPKAVKAPRSKWARRVRSPREMNGPDGYPKDNPAFDEAAAKVVEKTRPAAKKAERFLDELGKKLRETR